MDARFGRRVAHDADGLARAFAGARVGLGALAANRQPAQMANPTIALDTLKPFQIHADFPAQIAFNNTFGILDGMNDLGELLFSQVLGANAGIDIGAGENILRVAGPDAINVSQGDLDALVRWNFYSDDASHKLFLFQSWSDVFLALALFVAGVGTDHTDDAFA